MRSSRVLALDLGASRLTFALFAGDSLQGLRLDELATASIDVGATSETAWGEEVARAVGRFSARVRHRGAVRIAIPGHLAFAKCVRTPAITGAKRRRVVEFEATQNIPHALEEVWWDHGIIDPLAADLDIVLMAAKRSAMSALCAALAVPGWQLERAVPAATALHGCLRWNYPDASAPVLLVSVGSRSTHLIVSGEKRLWLRTVGFGENWVRPGITTPLNADVVRSTAPQQAVTSGPGEAVVSDDGRNAAEQGAAQYRSRLQLEIARTLAGFSEHRPGESIARFYLIGGGAPLPMLADFLHEQFKIPVERFDPLRRVSTGAPTDGLREAGPGLAVAVGLVAPAGVAGNVLPPEVRRRAERRRRQPAWLAAAALFMAALLPPGWHFHRVALTTEAEVFERRQQLEVLRAAAQRNAASGAQWARVREEIAAHRTLADARTHWVAFLADLQARLGEVEDVWLDELSVLENVSEPGAEGVNAGAAAGGLRLIVSGRLFDASHPSATVGEESYARARKLLASLTASPFVIAIGEERFDDRQPAVLRFSCQLTTKGPG